MASFWSNICKRQKIMSSRCHYSRINSIFAERNKNEKIMARPIRETPILTGEDAERFVRQMQEVEARSPEERDSRRKAFKERVKEAKKLITFCW